MTGQMAPHLRKYVLITRDGDEVRAGLTFAQAAKRVARHVKTVKRWKRNGMVCTLVDGRNIVDEEDLLKWWRERMVASPIRVYQVRKVHRGVDGE
ncbi:hypothetical protein [Cryobacterium psychrophilum]|uniref:DNA-binding protein n=1 Tax=Cryobacterium psychrophilum TaxID=41988 RepID=A0A4Y8KR93_9MICO|nr:hypothetical protein [Cryobacterium psychrophilum]TDW31004.1 hypothetical protein EDD25_2792 [Cryobacterium psychrophilum]TFD80862.1 hypothetical protein E3T53_04360 [Cryobacterium psychrophilum]